MELLQSSVTIWKTASHVYGFGEFCHLIGTGLKDLLGKPQGASGTLFLFQYSQQ